MITFLARDRELEMGVTEEVKQGLNNGAHIPPVNHLVASLHPAQPWHLPSRGRAVQVHDHIVLSYHQL